MTFLRGQAIKPRASRMKKRVVKPLLRMVNVLEMLTRVSVKFEVVSMMMMPMFSR